LQREFAGDWLPAIPRYLTKLSDTEQESKRRVAHRYWVYRLGLQHKNEDAMIPIEQKLEAIRANKVRFVREQRGRDREMKRGKPYKGGGKKDWSESGT
jgi:hypothetical protein